MTCTAIVLRREPWAVEDPVLDTAIFIVDIMKYREEEMFEKPTVSEREMEDLRDALAKAECVIVAAKYSLRVGYGADDCGDHCMNSCHWCELRRAVKAAEGS